MSFNRHIVKLLGASIGLMALVASVSWGADGAGQAGAAGAISGSPLVAQWAHIGTDGTDTARFIKLVADGSGNVYGVGLFLGAVDFGNKVSAKGLKDGNSAFLVRYGPSGEPRWVRSVAAAKGSVFSLVAPDSGGAYVVGSIGKGSADFGNGVRVVGTAEMNDVIARYDAGGKTLWARLISPRQGKLRLAAAAAGPSGTLLLSGTIDMAKSGPIAFSNNAPGYRAFPALLGQGYTALLIKLDSSGRTLWVSGAACPGGGSDYRAMAVDDSNHIYVLGTAYGDECNLGAGVVVKMPAAMLLARYDSSGKALWGRTLFASSRYCDMTQVCVDKKGGVYVAGNLQTTRSDGDADLQAAFSSNVVIRGATTDGWAIAAKYNASGTLQWARKLASGTLDIHSMSADDRFLYVSGERKAVGAREQCLDFGDGVIGRAQPSWGRVELLVGYDLAGRTRWAMMPPFSGESLAILDSLAADGKGNLIAAGRVKGQDLIELGNGVSVTNPSTTDGPLMVRYKVGQQAVTAAGGATAAGSAPAGGPASTAGAGGTAGTGGAPCIVSAADQPEPTPYDPGAAIQWGVPVNTGAAGSPLSALWAAGVVAERAELSGRRFLAGVVDAAGNVCAVGSIGANQRYNFGGGVTTKGGAVESALIAKYSAAGKPLWAITPKPGAFSRFCAVAADASGNVYALGSADKGTMDFGGSARVDIQSGAPFLVKFDVKGKAQWVRAFSSSSMDDRRHTVAVDKAGGIYIAIADVIARLDASGRVTWTVRVSANNAKYRFNAIAVDGSGSLYVVGYASGPGPYDFGNNVSLGGASYLGKPILAKYDSSGRAQWVRGFQCQADSYASVGVDPQGGVYVTGAIPEKGIFDLGDGVTLQGASESQPTGFIIVKYDASGVAQWARSLGGPGYLGYVDSAIAGGRIYLAGSANHSVDTPGVGQFNFYDGGLLAACDSSGTVRWVVLPPWQIGQALLDWIAPSADGKLIVGADTAGMSSLWGPVLGGLVLGSGVVLDGSASLLLAAYKVP